MLTSDATWLSRAYEIVSDCFRVVIIEKKNNEEQGNSTPKVNEVEYSTVSGTNIRNEYNQVPKLYFFHAQLRLCLNFDVE